MRLLGLTFILYLPKNVIYEESRTSDNSLLKNNKRIKQFSDLKLLDEFGWFSERLTLSTVFNLLSLSVVSMAKK